MVRSVIARVNAGVAADVVRREKAEWERVIAEFEKLAPPNAVVRQVEVQLQAVSGKTPNIRQKEVQLCEF